MKLLDVWILAPILLALYLMVPSRVEPREPASVVLPMVQEHKDDRILKVAEKATIQKHKDDRLLKVAEKVKKGLANLPALRNAKVECTGDEIQITLSSSSIFIIGTADTVDGVNTQLKSVAKLLKKSKKPLQIFVEGHTDSSPVIRNRGRYPSNWELSTSRAQRVVRLFEQAGIPSNQLGGAGFAATRPIGARDAQNRRIVIKVR